MKTNRYPQIYLCDGENLAESVAIYNEFMRRHGDDKTLSAERVGEKFLIRYTVQEYAPETFAEAKALEGCKHICAECTHCVRKLNRRGEPDKRSKRAACNLYGDSRTVWLDQQVCDEFYFERQDERKEEA
jgi:hypothetical protein